MDKLPSFLRTCDKLPLPNDDHRWRKAFELVVSLEALLKINNAAEILFAFLLDNCPKPDYGEHDEDDEEDDEATKVPDCVTWLSDGIYIITREVVPELIDDIIFYSFYVQQVQKDSRRSYFVSICHAVPTPPTAGEQSELANMSSSVSSHDCAIGTAIDAVMQLLANHKTIDRIVMLREDGMTSLNEPFPGSVDVLKAFVSDAQSPRSLCFRASGLTIDEWRIILSNCNMNCTLNFWMYSPHDCKLEALFEAMKLNLCPAQLAFWNICKMPTDMFQKFVSVLTSTTCLKALEIGGMFGDGSILISLFGAISRNHGLERLELNPEGAQENISFSDSQWELVCNALACHPTLTTLELDVSFSKSSVSQERDEVFIQHVSRNPILCKLKSTARSFYDSKNVEQVVRPFLKVNSIRPVVESIKQQATDSTRRQKLFTTALLSAQISQHPACRFWLLKENSDLLAELSWPENVFLARWNRSIARVLAIEQEMQNWDMPLPSLEPLLEGKKRRR